MRYSSALVLSTLAVGQAAAGSHHLRHAGFHARRSANAAGPGEVDWNNVVRDAVDYKAATDKISQAEWDAIFASQKGQPAASPAPVAAPAPPPASKAPEPPKAQPTSAKPSSTSDAPAPAKESKKPSSGGANVNVLEAIGCTAGDKMTAASAGSASMWVGDGAGQSKTQMTFTNDADEAVAILCVNKDTMFNTKSDAVVAKNIAAGESLTISLGYGASGNCAAAKVGSTFHMSGIINESLLEFTTASNPPKQYENGVYDISREVNMDGLVMSATGNRQCTSGVKNGQVSCAFGCVGGAKSCEATGTYNIIKGSDTSGYCEIGKDPFTGGASGGCQMDPSGDHIKVTITGARDWPACDF